MELNPHHQVLLAVFAIAFAMGLVAQKTRFCTMGAVSDWVNMGDTGRMRAWLLSMAVAIAGVLLLHATGKAVIPTDTFPPYRTPHFAWLRYLLGGFAFGVGMTLASGCGSRTLIRIGGGNVKSVLVLAVTAVCAYLMIWTDLYAHAFQPWVGAASVNLAEYGARSQALGDIVGAITGYSGASLNVWLGWALVAAIASFVFASRDFRSDSDNILGGLVVGLAVAAGWYVTAGSLGQEWKDWAAMSPAPPSRVEVQSYTFVSPMADTLRYLLDPTNFGLITFGVVALAGVIAGSALHALRTRNFHIEWFATGKDFGNHVLGGALMGFGGVLAMGCTIGQAVTGVSTLAVGSLVTFAAIVAGSAATLKYQYWRLTRE